MVKIRIKNLLLIVLLLRVVLSGPFGALGVWRNELPLSFESLREIIFECIRMQGVVD